MTLEDQFFLSKEEVVRALAKIQEVFNTWLKLQEANSSSDIIENTRTELRNSIRSIEWDIEDLEETLGIVEKNPKKFKIEDVEIKERRNFIERTREEIQTMKQSLYDQAPPHEKSLIKSLLNSGGKDQKYTLVDTEPEVPIYTQQQLKQEKVYQPTTLPSIEALRDLNKKMSKTVDEHSVMLDDGPLQLHVVEPTFSSSISQALTTLRHDSRKRWMVLGAVSSVVFIVVIITCI